MTPPINLFSGHVAAGSFRAIVRNPQKEDASEDTLERYQSLEFRTVSAHMKNNQKEIHMAQRTKRTGGRRQTSPSRNRRGKESESMEAEPMENPLHEAFLEEVADIYNAEQQLIKALPKMAKAAESEELRQAFEEHLNETEEQARRIEEAMSTLDESIKKKNCKGMAGLLAEGEEMMKEHKGEPSIDAILIAAAQKVEHYEIASYGTICTWAEQMGHGEALDLFKENLGEEKATDEKLTQIAETLANPEAEQQDV
jgi:ferritin-like metal-binding protein YciE